MIIHYHAFLNGSDVFDDFWIVISSSKTRRSKLRISKKLFKLFQTIIHPRAKVFYITRNVLRIILNMYCTFIFQKLFHHFWKLITTPCRYKRKDCKMSISQEIKLKANFFLIWNLSIVELEIESFFGCCLFLHWSCWNFLHFWKTNSDIRKH